MKTIIILLPALIHAYIWVLESFLWGSEKTNKTFGLQKADAAATKSMAFNQGFYNLMLSMAVVLGLVLSACGKTEAGSALTSFGLVCMVFAGLVLVSNSPKLWRSALFQIVPGFAALAVLFLL